MTGLLDITDGTVSDNKLSWTMKATGSMPMILDCMTEVNGDAITGTMKLGFYGTSHFSGTRRARQMVGRPDYNQK